MPRKDQETFEYARYLFFVASASDDSFNLFIQNESRDLSSEDREDDESALIQSYMFDRYNFDEIRQHIEKYLIEELVYF